jgi:hypothetical protein
MFAARLRPRLCEIRKLSSISRFEHESQKKVASLPILGLDSRSRISDLSFHSQPWPIGAKLWPSTSSRPTISTSVNTTWRTACTIQDFLERAGTTPTFLTRYNITPMQNNSALAASSFTFNPVQLYSTCN